MDYYFDNSKNLDELEGIVWNKPESDSHLVQVCCKLRQTPLNLFKVEDLRIMIGQNIGLLHLIPLVIEVLKINPLAEGDYFAGDLLEAVINANTEFWKDNLALKKRIEDIISNTINNLQTKLQKFKDKTDN
jgi:hypothetical protein